MSYRTILNDFEGVDVAWSSVIGFGAGLLLSWVTIQTVYRVWFHPLAKFPGPRTSAVTSWYEFYYDAFYKGQFIWKIQEMHEKYGPIVRISPNELHVNDAAFANVLYARGNQKRDTIPPFVARMGMKNAASATSNHDLHRTRRGALNPYFSKASIIGKEDILKRNSKILVNQMEKYSGSGNPISLQMAFNCFTGDAIMEFAFGKSYGFLEDATFARNFHKGIFSMICIEPWLNYFPIVYYILRAMPEFLVTKTNPDMALYVTYQNELRDQVKKTISNKYAGKPRTKRFLFEELVYSSLAEKEKTVERLWAEGLMITGAGTETTSWTLCVTFYHILAEPNIMDKLITEIQSVIPSPEDTPSWTELEKLPYLTAVLNEGLRLSYGIAKRTPELAHQPLIFKSSTGEEWVIPPFTPVGMTATFVHHDPSIFPDPGSFRPERWLKRDRGLNRWLVTFGLGSRGCLGINLAMAELYIITATIVRRFGTRLRLHETTRENVDIYGAYFVPVPKLEKDVKIIIQ